MNNNTAIENWINLINGNDVVSHDAQGVSERIDIRNLRIAKPHATKIIQTGPADIAVLTGLTEARGVIWRNIDFSDSQLPSLRFFDSEILDCNFDNCKLSDLRAWGTHFIDVSFRGADLRGAVLGPFYNGKRNLFNNVDFENANLRNTNYQSAEFVECKFSDTNLTKVEFQGSTFAGCIFEGELREVIFYAHAFGCGGAPQNEMKNVDFSRATLRWCAFRGLNLDTVVFPADESHMIIQNYPQVIDQLLFRFCNKPEPWWRRLTAVLNDARKWLGPQQRVGIFNKNDLIEIVGNENVEELVGAINLVAG